MKRVRRPRATARPNAPQPQLFDDEYGDDHDDSPAEANLELQRDIHRMTLETSSNLYAQRRSQW